MSEPAASSRLHGRRLWVLVILAALALLLAIVFGLWINSDTPLQPVPVASRPSA